MLPYKINHYYLFIPELVTRQHLVPELFGGRNNIELSESFRSPCCATNSPSATISTFGSGTDESGEYSRYEQIASCKFL